MKLYRHAKVGEGELVAELGDGGGEVADGAFKLRVARDGDKYVIHAEGFPQVILRVAGGEAKLVEMLGDITGGFGIEVDKHGVTWLLEGVVYRLVL